MNTVLIVIIPDKISNTVCWCWRFIDTTVKCGVVCILNSYRITLTICWIISLSTVSSVTWVWSVNFITRLGSWFGEDLNWLPELGFPIGPRTYQETHTLPNSAQSWLVGKLGSPGYFRRVNLFTTQENFQLFSGISWELPGLPLVIPLPRITILPKTSNGWELAGLW